MAWFFTDCEIDRQYTIWGEDALHIKKSLRMKAGEELTLVTPASIQHRCRIDDISDRGEVSVTVHESKPCTQEPNVKVTLYQGLPKGDKMDFIVQKAVELGVAEIVPVLTDRSISRPDEKSMSKKISRWQKIALGAAQQARRGTVPTVLPLLSLEEASKRAGLGDASLVFYEGGGKSLSALLQGTPKSIGIFIGSEGGFDEKEIARLNASGIENATLGKRILRAETAPLAALTAIMLLTGNLD